MVKRVVLIADRSDPRDGPTNIAILLAKTLRRSGISVDYISGDSGENYTLHDIGVKVVPLNQQALDVHRPYESVSRGLFNKKVYAVISNYIRETDDSDTVYHVHNWSKMLSPSVFLALQPVAQRSIITAHDYFLACPNGGFFNYNRQQRCELVPLSADCVCTNCDRRSYGQKIWRVIRASRVRRYLNFVANGPTVVAVHPGMLPYLRRGGLNDSRLVVLRNPCTAWTDQRVEVERNRSLLFVGRLDHDKGADLLASAAAAAGVRVTFIGDGPLRAELEAQYPQFEFAGWQHQEEIGRYAQYARLTVVPSASRETFSLVAFESLSSGIPVLLSEFATTVDQIVDYGFGFAINPYDTGSFSALIGRVCHDDALVREMSLRCWADRASLTSTVDQWSRETIQLYADLTEKPHTDVANCA